MKDPRREWIVEFDQPLSKFPVLTDDYPAPEWVEPPTSDFRLTSLILPIPRSSTKLPSSITIPDDEFLEDEEKKKHCIAKLEQTDQKPVV